MQIVPAKHALVCSYTSSQSLRLQIFGFCCEGSPLSSSSNLFFPATWNASSQILLFCFPYAGGSPYLFMDWKADLLPEVQLAALQAPGHGSRLTDPAHHSADEILCEIIPVFSRIGDRRFAFYGHSLGAIIAFELARRLRKAGLPQPCHLFVGAARPPQLGPTLPGLHRLEEHEFLEGVQTRYGGIPAEILSNPEVLSIFLPALRADFTVYETYKYQPEPPLACPISAFAGMQDLHVPVELMADWEAHTTAGFNLRGLRGDHFFLVESRSELTGSILHTLTASR
jgi:medium-chain acyl-[acyl-carrier-protein] hydrolase